jgi:hypothetical protein
MTTTTHHTTTGSKRAAEPASPAQINWLTKASGAKPALLDAKDWEKLDGANYERAFDLATGSGKFISKPEASMLISALLKLPKKPAAGAPADPEVPVAEPPSEEGIYILGDRAFKVQRSARGRLYTKEYINNPVSDSGKPEDDRWHLEYDPSGIGLLTADNLASADEQAAWGRKTGHCIRCNTRLEHPKSLQNGLGDYCYKRAYGRTPPKLVL